jgi:hypothetical protein
MYVLYYASMLRCWHLIWILVRTNHSCLGVDVTGCMLDQVYSIPFMGSSTSCTWFVLVI